MLAWLGLGIVAHGAVDSAGRSPHTKLAPEAVNVSEHAKTSAIHSPEYIAKMEKLAVKKSGGSDTDQKPESTVIRTDDDVLDITDVMMDGIDMKMLQLRPKSSVLVNATIVITDIPLISSDDERAEFQGQLVMMWRDPRLKLPNGQSRIQLNDHDVWSPQVDFYNVIGAVKIPAIKMALLQVRDRSYLVKTQRFFGSFASRTDGTYFPFDRQMLPIVVEMFGNPAEAVAFDPDLYQGLLEHVPSAKDDFHVDGIRTSLTNVPKVTGRQYSRLAINVLVTRKWVNKIFPCYAPVTILLILCCMSVYIDPASVPARTTLTIVCLLSSIMIHSHLEQGAPGFSYTDALGVWTIVCAAGSVALFLRVHWLRQTEDVAWKIRMEKLAGEPEPEEFKDNSTKKMLRKLGMLGREESPPSKRVDEVARVWMPAIFVVEIILFIIPAMGSINADYAGSVEHIG
jgi:uncharacterized protein YsxB (DUF464 family)